MNKHNTLRLKDRKNHVIKEVDFLYGFNRKIQFTKLESAVVKRPHSKNTHVFKLINLKALNIK